MFAGGCGRDGLDPVQGLPAAACLSSVESAGDALDEDRGEGVSEELSPHRAPLSLIS